MKHAGDFLAAANKSIAQRRAREKRPYNLSSEEVKATMRDPSAKALAEVERISAPHAAALHPKALQMYKVLIMTSLYTLRARGAAVIPSQVAMLVPGEALAHVLSCDVKTMRKYRDQLEAAGLIDSRSFYQWIKGNVRRAGLLWAIRLDPRISKPVKLTYEDFKRRYRDLRADIENKKTCYIRYKTKFPHTISGLKTVRRNISELLLWTLPPLSESLALLMYGEKTRAGVLDDVLAVPGTPHSGRGAAVAKAALGMARSLGDLKSFEKYCGLLWQALRLQVFGGIDLFGVLYNLAAKCAVDAKEGFARKPGALFMDRLKRSGHYDTLMNQPKVAIM